MTFMPARWRRKALQFTACVICGNPANFKSFGADACRGCGAFFRRAISSPKLYRCKRQLDCIGVDAIDLNARSTSSALHADGTVRKQIPCASCRLRRCLAAGMDVTGVQTREVVCHITSLLNEASVLRRATAFRTSMFVWRTNLLLQSGADQADLHQPTTPVSSLRMYSVERRILREFLSIMGNMSSYLRSDVTVADLSTHFFVVWYTLESALATQRNHGFRRGKAFVPDETYLDVSADTMERWFSAIPLRNADVLARYAADQWRAFLVLSEELHRRSFDDTEITAICLLLFAKYESVFFASVKLRREFVSAVLGDLYVYYEESAMDYTLCFDRIISVLTGFHDAFRDLLEYLTMVGLNAPTDPHPDRFTLLHSCRYRIQTG